MIIQDILKYENERKERNKSVKMKTKPRTSRFVESTLLSGKRLDREACKIFGVKIIGTESTNGRTYPIDVLTKAIPLYEGVRVYFDHVGEENPKHSVTTLFGFVENVHAEPDGLYADLAYNPKHLYAEQILYQVEHAPDKLGLSPHHEGILERSEDGTATITEITAVYSVDIVDRPATTDGMFEAEDLDTTEEGKKKMDWKALTVEDLEANRPDIVKTIQASIATDLQAQNDLLSVAIEDVIASDEPAPVEPVDGLDELDEEDDPEEDKKKKDEEMCV